MMKTPGNWTSVSGPFFTTVPPIISVQNFVWASTFFTTKWMWPSRTPRSFGGSASCANAATELRIRHRKTGAIGNQALHFIPSPGNDKWRNALRTRGERLRGEFLRCERTGYVLLTLERRPFGLGQQSQRQKT